MAYIPPTTYPVVVINGVRCDYQEHKNRKPPSREPGTDYACPMRSPLVACAAGTVLYVMRANAEGTGRFVGIHLNDGRYVRYLHMDSVTVKVNQRVKQGQVVGYSGNSGGVGPHVHVSLFARPNMPFAMSIDFEQYLGTPAGDGGSTPLPIPPKPSTPIKEIDMPVLYYRDSKGNIFALNTLTGTSRAVGPGEWSRVQAAYKTAGVKVPFADEMK